MKDNKEQTVKRMIVEIGSTTLMEENKVKVVYDTGEVVYDPTEIKHLILNERDIKNIQVLRSKG